MTSEASPAPSDNANRIGTATRPKQEVASEALLEDVFGLNVRGVVTLRDLFWRPKRVFDAARTRDWNGRYTPSIRLAFFLLTVFSFFSFLWAAEGSPVYEQFSRGLTVGAEDELEQGRITRFAKAAMGGYAAAYPFAYIVLQGLAALVLPVWGRGTSAALRVRLHFAALCPGAAVNVAYYLLMPALGGLAGTASSVAVSAVGSLLDGATAARAGLPGSRFEQVLRACVFALGVMVVATLATLLAILGGLVVQLVLVAPPAD